MVDLLLRIWAFVSLIDCYEYFRSDLEYSRFKQVKAHVVEDEKRTWMKNPPWLDEE